MSGRPPRQYRAIAPAPTSNQPVPTQTVAEVREGRVIRLNQLSFSEVNGAIRYIEQQPHLSRYNLQLELYRPLPSWTKREVSSIGIRTLRLLTLSNGVRL